MVAFLENEFVSRKEWLTKEEFLDILAVSESTPGPIAVNTATYIGYRVASVLGSLLATFAVCLPSFSIIFVISLFFDRFLALTWVQFAFRGIQVAVVYLIASAGIKLFKSLEKNVFSWIVSVSVFVLFVALSLFALRFSTIFYILISGVLGLALYAFRILCARVKKEGEKETEDSIEGEAPLADPSQEKKEEDK